MKQLISNRETVEATIGHLNDISYNVDMGNILTVVCGNKSVIVPGQLKETILKEIKEAYNKSLENADKALQSFIDEHRT